MLFDIYASFLILPLNQNFGRAPDDYMLFGSEFFEIKIHITATLDLILMVTQILKFSPIIRIRVELKTVQKEKQFLSNYAKHSSICN